MAGVIDRLREAGRALAGAPSQIVSTTAGYMKSGVSTFMFRWNPALRDEKDHVREAWSAAAARATDTIQNSGWIAGGINSACGQTIGAGLRLNCRPDTTVVKFDGLTDDAGSPIDEDGWARFVERRWEAWSNNPRECDARGRQTIAQMTWAAFKTWFATGEMLATIPHYEEEEGVTSSTKVLLVPPHRLSQTTNPMTRTYQGIEMDARGRPYAYVFRMTTREGVEQDVRILARDGIGRPQVVHIFDGLPTQVRGITPLVPALQVVKQFDQLSNSTLMAALIQTIFAATVESDAPTSDILNALSSGDTQGVGGDLESFLAARMGWSTGQTLDLGPEAQSKIAHLFPGEKLKFNRSEHPNTVYEQFAMFLLREIAKTMGVTVEQLTGNYTGVTYTGVRMSSSDIWQLVLHRRNNLVGRFLQMIYEAWLEEEVETGRIKFPGGFENFVRFRTAACRAVWRGPPKPQADDLKAAKTHLIYREMGVMTDEMIAADLGQEISDVYQQRAREKTLRAKWGVDDMGPSMQTKVAEIANEPDDPDEPPVDPEARAAA